MCVLADICNHTWIPECGQEKGDGSKRLFLDECDLYEYSYYEIMNYSECFMAQSCPTTIPCPSKPTCPNHAFHRMGQHYLFLTEARKMMRPPQKITTKINLPKHMLHGKRRYTPIPRCRRGKLKHTTARRTIPKNTNIKPIKIAMTKNLPKTTTKRDTVILRRETILRNGKIFVKIVKGFASDVVTNHIKEDSDFLEK